MLAAFRSIVTIQEHFQQEYGLELAARQIGGYDPSRTYYDAGQKWREVFDFARKRYLEEVASVPAANQGYRLNLLNEMIKDALKEKKPALAAQLLKQAAEEVGGVLTNQRDVKIQDDRKQAARDMTPEDRKMAVAELIRQAMDQMGKPGNTPPPKALQ